MTYPNIVGILIRQGKFRFRENYILTSITDKIGGFSWMHDKRGKNFIYKNTNINIKLGDFAWLSERKTDFDCIL